jgi:protein CpxP
MYKTILWISAFTASLVLSQTTFAADACRENMSNVVTSMITDKSQREKIKPILEQLKSNLQDKRAQLKELQVKINEQEQSKTMDESVVDGLVDKKAMLLGGMMKAKIQAKHQILNLLDDKQKRKLNDKMQQIENKMAAKFKNCHDED